LEHLLFVPKVVLLLVIALVAGVIPIIVITLVAGVIPVIVVVLVGRVEFLPLGAVDDEMSGVATLEVASW
jgi:hypothetical protein